MPDTPNGILVEPIFTYLGQRMENVYCVTKGSPATAADLLQVAQIQENWERNTARTRRSIGVTCVSIDVTALDGPGAPILAYTPPNPAIVGTVNNPMSPILTAVITHRTGKKGRSFRGRSYWVGLGTNQTATVETLTAATVTDLVAIYGTLRAAYLAAGYTMCVLSLYSGKDAQGRKLPRAQGLMTPITSHTADNYIDTQRHRKIRPST